MDHPKNYSLFGRLDFQGKPNIIPPNGVRFVHEKSWISTGCLWHDMAGSIPNDQLFKNRGKNKRNQALESRYMWILNLLSLISIWIPWSRKTPCGLGMGGVIIPPLMNDGNPYNWY